ncbi:MAG: GAF domain-containing protein [Nocardioidaceae bacterium]
MTSPSPELASLLVRIGNLSGQAAKPTSMRGELTRAAASVRQLFAAAACSVGLVEPDGEQQRFVAADGAGAKAIIDVTLPVQRGIAGWVAMAGQGIAVGDVERDSRFARDVAEATDYVPQSILAVPLVGPHGDTVGVIEVLDPQFGGEDTGHALDVLGTVGDQVAAIVRLAQVYDGLGAALLHAVAAPGDEESFGTALRELAGPDDDGQLAALAATFHDLARGGPEAAQLAHRVLTEVAAYARTQR